MQINNSVAFVVKITAVVGRYGTLLYPNKDAKDKKCLVNSIEGDC